MLRKIRRIGWLLLLTAMIVGAASGTETIAADGGTGGYWVVSTYGLPQDPGVCPPHIKFPCYYKQDRMPLQAASLAQMQQSIDPNAPTCIFVHGSFVDPGYALQDAENTYRWLKQGNCGKPLNVIFFLWPSREPETVLFPVMVLENGLKAAHNGTYLAYLLDTFPAGHRVCLIGHSHGVRLIAAGLHYRAGGIIQGRQMARDGKTPLCIRAIFAAAAINHNWLNLDNRYGLAMSEVDSVLNLINHRDVALTLYPLVSLSYGRALAKIGVTLFDRQKLGAYADKIYEMNVSPIVGVRHVWEAYYSQPQLARALAPYIQFQGSRQQPMASTMAILEEFERPSDSQTVRIELPLPDPTTPALPMTLPPAPGPTTFPIVTR